MTSRRSEERVMRPLKWLLATLRLDRPEPPTNVRVVTSEGREVPAELVYAGRRGKDGTHVWEAVAETWIGAATGGWSIRADVVPANTTISLTLSGRWDA